MISHLEDTPEYLAMGHEPQAGFMDGYDCGLFWMFNKENNIIMHNGEVEMDDDNAFADLIGYYTICQ